MRVVIERGYAGATTKQLPVAAGVSEVTLIRKYDSKAQLVRLAILFIADRMEFESASETVGMWPVTC